jgi:predicted NBD/HSP70 family sugar kinase
MSEPTFLGSNISLVKSHNLRVILLNLLYGKDVSRVQLAEKTSLSTTTITNLVSELLEQGVLVEEGNEEVSGRRRVGRPRTTLRMVPNARYAVGVHIGIGIFRIAITDLYGEIVYGNIYDFNMGDDPYDVLHRIAEEIEHTIIESQVEPAKVVGVGVGASGLVDHREGVNVFSPNLGWRNVPVRDILLESLDIPVIVDNNVRCMALGEAFFGEGKNAYSLAFVYGRIGVGAGFVVNGQVFRGSAAGAGEIGHTIIVQEYRDEQVNEINLEKLISEATLIDKAEKLAKEMPDSLLAQKLTREIGATDKIEAIFSAAREGDQKCLQMIGQSAYHLGVALANLVNVLNPDLIILGGMLAQGHDLILPSAERVMKEKAFAGLGAKVRVQTTCFGWRAGVTGAATLALNAYFYQQPEGI